MIRIHRQAVSIVQGMVPGDFTVRHHVNGRSHLAIEIYTPTGKRRQMTFPTSPRTGDNMLDWVRQNTRRALRELACSS